MSAYVTTDERIESAPVPRFLPTWDGKPTVALEYGHTTVYLDTTTAGSLALAILAAIPVEDRPHTESVPA